MTREVQADRAQLVDDPTVAARRVGLALQRRELAAHLAQEIVEPEEIALGGLEPALGAFAPLAVLQDAAASSTIARRSSGREFSTASSWPWPTMTCC